MIRGALAALVLAGCASAETGAGSVAGRVVGAGEAFVYVKGGLEDRTYPVPSEPVVLDQVDFTFVPRVFGIRVGQTLRITSQDSSLHNVNCQPFENPPFNESLFGGESRETKFTVAEVMILFQCNIHPQMRAHAGVVDHPFFAVAGPDGSFRFEGLPAGRYVLAAWHEEKGLREAEVRVRPDSVARVEIRFP